MHWRKLLGVITLAVLFLTACSGNNNDTTSTAKSAFVKGPCPFKVGTGLVEGKDVSCGFLSAPEDRTNAQSKSIKLAVAIFKNPNASAPADPMIYLEGGPGGGGVYDFASLITAQNRSIFQWNRDLILIDQRGTGYSQPSLACPEVVKLEYMTAQPTSAEQGVAAQDKALNDCHQRLVNQGINLSDFNTYNSANDVHDLIGALGYQHVNLWGISYGTRLAQEVMRAFPQHIRSVVLDSTVPPSMINLISQPQSLGRDFSLLFQTCAAEASCNATYPNLQQELYTLIDKLNANPVTFQATDGDLLDPKYGNNFTIAMRGTDLANLIFEMFYATTEIPNMPKMIDEINNGNYTDLLAKEYGELGYSGEINIGLYYSIRCAEETEFTTPDQISSASQAYPAPIRSDENAFNEAMVGECQRWGVPEVNTSERNPVTSSIPTLVLEAELDPITPPANGDLVAKSLSNSYTFLFPGIGHGVFATSRCALSVQQAFENDPSQKPDGSCISTLGEPQFQ